MKHIIHDRNDRILLVDGLALSMSEDVYNSVCELKNKLEKVENENIKLVTELQIIKPVLEKKDLAPAVGSHCGYCRYAVKSRWDGEVIGCCKNIVCEDFIPEDNK